MTYIRGIPQVQVVTTGARPFGTQETVQGKSPSLTVNF